MTVTVLVGARCNRDARGGPAWLFVEFLEEACRVPNMLGDLPVQVLPRVEVGLLKVGMRFKRQPGLRPEVTETRIMIIGFLVEALNEQVQR